MKNKFFLVIVMACSMLLYYACKKKTENSNASNENVIGSNTENLSANMRVATAGITYANGMLNFPSQTSFNDTYNSLKNEVKTIASNVLDVNGYDLGHQSQIDFENSFSGFISARKRFNSSEITQSMSGLEPQNIHSPIILDNVLITLLNNKYQVKIGDKIFYKKNQVTEFIILNNDITALNAMVSNSNPLSYPNVVPINTEFKGCDFANDYIAVVASGVASTATAAATTPTTAGTFNLSPTVSPCSSNQDLKADFTKIIALDNNNKATISYTGSRGANIYVKYNYGDGTSSEVMQASLTANLTKIKIYANSGNYPVKLELWNSSTSIYKVSNQNVSVGACFININPTDNGNGSFSFQASISNGVGPANGTYFWNFGDGNVYTGGANISNTYSCSGSKTVTVSYLSTSCGTVSQSSIITVPLISNSCRPDVKFGPWCPNVTSTERLEIEVEHGVGWNLFSNKPLDHVFADVYYDYWEEKTFLFGIKRWVKKAQNLEIRRYGDLYKKDATGNCDCSTPVSIVKVESCQSCKDLNIKTDIGADGNKNYAKINPTAGAYVEFYSGGAYRGRVNIK
jgi:PKD domain